MYTFGLYLLDQRLPKKLPDGRRQIAICTGLCKFN